MDEVRKLRVGVSSCLLGNPVRFNGDHSRHDWISDVLSREVALVAVCPEMAMGLGAPRPALRLVMGQEVEIHTAKTGTDMTPHARAVSRVLAERAGELHGFILRKNSPTCGYERVKVYPRESSGIPARTGQGVFARELRRAQPLLPIIEDGRLADPAQREGFILRVYAFARMRELGNSMSAIQAFHRQHKLLLLEHSPADYYDLGKLVGNSRGLSAAALLVEYAPLFMQALEVLPTRKTRTNALQHVLGFLRGSADSYDRHQVAEMIDLYRKGEVPFISPLTLLSHLVRKARIRYLEDQTFFSPYPRLLGTQGRL